MVVDRRLIDARFGDNCPNACAVIAPLGEQGDRGLHYTFACISGRGGFLHPLKNQNKFLNPASASLPADAITGSCDEAPALCGELDFLFRPIFSFHPSPPAILWSQTNV